MATRRIQYGRECFLAVSSSRVFKAPPSLMTHLRTLGISKILKKTEKKSKEASLEFCHLNINGILDNNKFEYVHQLLLNSPNTILALTESHLYQDFPVQLVELSGFKCYRKDRVGKKGGGVLLYVPDFIFSEQVEITINQQSSVLEQLWVRCGIGTKIVLLACLYRPPNIPHDQTRQSLIQVEEILTRYPGADRVLMGDLNIDISQGSYNRLKQDLLSFCEINQLSINDLDYTRIATRTWDDGTTTTSKTMIDVILCSPPGNYCH